MPRPVSLTPELLQTFVSVAMHEGDAVAAAYELGINQPSMSKRLAILQHSGRVLRRPWLERKGKRWFLTDEGRRLLPAAEDVLRRYDQLRKFAAASTPAGLAVACGQEVVAGIVLATAREFRKKYPDRPFRISTRGSQARIEGVANGMFDLALVVHEPSRINLIARRDLHIEDLYDDPLVLAVSPRAACAELFSKLPDTGVTAKAVASLPLVLFESGTGLRKPFDEKLLESGQTVNAVVECGGLSALLDYVKEGFGVGLLPRSVAARDSRLICKTMLGKITPANTIRLICRFKHHSEGGLDLTEDAQAFRDLLLSQATAEFTEA